MSIGIVTVKLLPTFLNFIFGSNGIVYVMYMLCIYLDIGVCYVYIVYMTSNPPIFQSNTPDKELERQVRGLAVVSSPLRRIN
jgi:hypothetical protein